MNATMTIGRRLMADESGATAIEYGLLAALIAVVIIGVVASLGGTLKETFAKVDSEITAKQAENLEE